MGSTNTAILGNAHKIEVGKVTNYGIQTAEGFAIYEAVASEHGEDSRGRKRRRWYDYAVSNCIYAPELQAAILQPSIDLTHGISLNDVITNDDTYFDTCIPAGLAATNLFMFNNTANYASAIASATNLPSTPYFLVQFTRRPMAPDGMAWTSQAWEFTFGNGFKLQWSRIAPPRLYYHGALLSEYAMDQRDMPEITDYATNTRIVWQIANLNGQIIITSSVLSDEWVIGCHPQDYIRGRNELAGSWASTTDKPWIGDVQAAPWGFSSNGGQYAINVIPYTYATQGTIDTPWIEHFGEYANGAVNFSVWPTKLPAGCGITAAVLETNGSRKKYRITMTGNGSTSPLLSAFQFWYMPQLQDHDAYWYDITPFCQKLTVNLPQDASARSVSIELLPGIPRGIYDNIYAMVGGEMLGQWAARIWVGNQTTGGKDQKIVLTGFMPTRGMSKDVKSLQNMAITIDDRWLQLNKTAFTFAPCVAGMRVDLALYILAQFAGIPPSQIQSEVIDAYLDCTDYLNPSYYPAYGTCAGEFMKSIAATYGVVCEFDAQGILHIRNSHDTSAVASYSDYNTETNELRRIIKIDDTIDVTDAKNDVVVEGMSHSGERIFARRFDYESIYDENTDRYIGFPSKLYIKNHDLATQNSVNLACANAYNERPAGWRKVTISGNTADIWKLEPYNYVMVYDKIFNKTYRIRIVSVNIEATKDSSFMTSTAVGEVRP